MINIGINPNRLTIKITPKANSKAAMTNLESERKIDGRMKGGRIIGGIWGGTGIGLQQQPPTRLNSNAMDHSSN
jgi:hypothetical protein